MKPLLATLSGQTTDISPMWIMRQAGRYLPEYRELRAKAGSFLDLVYNPKMAAEVTIQPIRRYAMDGAILFSDILIVPHALGQDVKFVEGKGPVLTPIQSDEDVAKLDTHHGEDKFDSVANTVSLIREGLSKEGFDHTTTIGFAGSPFTVACYMVEGGGSKEFLNVKAAAIKDGWFEKMIERVTAATIVYLKKQIEAGAEAIQLFDSWAGILDDALFEKFVIDPTAIIVKALKRDHPDIPIIGFPRGAGVLYERYATQTHVDALGLDTSVPLDMAKSLQEKMPVQGNMDPAYLLGSEKQMLDRARDVLKALSDGPHIFNLGHGISKDTNPDMVKALVDHVRSSK